MAVNKIEYKLDSSTAGFAQAGDEVLISTANAKRIEKDVEMGNTESLTTAQENFLNQNIQSADSVSYTETDTSDNTLEMTDNTEDSSNNSSAGLISGAAGTLFGTGMMASLAALTPSMNTYTAISYGKVDIALGTAAIADVLAFDVNYSARMSEFSEADSDISALNAQLEILNADIEALSDAANDSEKASADGDETATADNMGASSDAGEVPDELQQLFDKLAECQANGNNENASIIETEIQNYISNMSKETESENPFASVQANNLRANDLYSASVSTADILNDGTALGAMGTANTAALTSAAVLSKVLGIKAYIGMNPLQPWTLETSPAGSIMCTVAAGLFVAAAASMAAKTVTEFEAGARGNNLENTLNSFQAPLMEHNNLAAQLQGEDEETSSESFDALESTIAAAAASSGVNMTTSSAANGSTAASGGSTSSSSTTSSGSSSV